MINLSQRLSALRADKIPPGWFTVDQMAAREGYSTGDSFKVTLYRAIKAGLVESRTFRVAWGGGVRHRPHYRYAKVKSAKN